MSRYNRIGRPRCALPTLLLLNLLWLALLVPRPTTATLPTSLQKSELTSGRGNDDSKNDGSRSETDPTAEGGSTDGSLEDGGAGGGASDEKERELDKLATELLYGPSKPTLADTGEHLGYTHSLNTVTIILPMGDTLPAGTLQEGMVVHVERKKLGPSGEVVWERSLERERKEKREREERDEQSYLRGRGGSTGTGGVGEAEEVWTLPRLKEQVVLLPPETSRTYKVGEVVLRKGKHWEAAREEIMSNPIYEGTVLRRYGDHGWEARGGFKEANIKKLSVVVKHYAADHGIDNIEYNRAILVHVAPRLVALGDGESDDKGLQHAEVMWGIVNKVLDVCLERDAREVVIVTALHSVGWSTDPDAAVNDLIAKRKAKVEQYQHDVSLQLLLDLAANLQKLQCIQKVTFLSHADVDVDLAYLAVSPHVLVVHKHAHTGGFGHVACYLREILWDEVCELGWGY